MSKHERAHLIDLIRKASTATGNRKARLMARVERKLVRVGVMA